MFLPHRYPGLHTQKFGEGFVGSLKHYLPQRLQKVNDGGEGSEPMPTNDPSTPPMRGVGEFPSAWGMGWGAARTGCRTWGDLVAVRRPHLPLGDLPVLQPARQHGVPSLPPALGHPLQPPPQNDAHLEVQLQAVPEAALGQPRDAGRGPPRTRIGPCDCFENA